MERSSASLEYSQDSIESPGALPQWDPEESALGSERLVPPAQEKRWDLAFFGVMLYILVEYSRLPAMFPILGILQLGKVAVLSGLLGCLLSNQANKPGRSSIGHIDALFAWLWIAVVLGALTAEFQTLALAGSIEVVIWLSVYFILSRGIDTPWRLRTVMFLFLLLNLKLAQFVVRGYIAGSAVAEDQMSFVGHGVGAGSTGFFGNSADLGVAMCVAWPIAISILFARPKFFTRGVAWACTFACLGAILLCGSRGAVVGAAAVAAGAWIKTPKKIIAMFMMILVLAGVYLVLPDASKQRFENARTPQEDDTAHHRLELWKAGMRMLADNPVFGVGIHNYAGVRFNHYPISIFNWVKSVPHSSLVEGASELGVLGFLPFILLWISFFRMNSRTRKILTRAGPEERRSYEYCLSVGLDLALIGYLASGAFVAVLWYPHIFVLMGLAAATHQVAQRRMANIAVEPEAAPALEVA